MIAFVRLDTMDGDYFVHRCPECNAVPEFADCGSDGKVIYCPTEGHEHKFCVDMVPIEASVKEWNERCARYVEAKNFRRVNNVKDH